MNHFQDLIDSWHREDVKLELGKRYLIKNTPLPPRFTALKKFTKRPDYFIIHDTNCLDHKTAALTVDGPQEGIGEVKSNNITISGMKEVNYHFLIDKIGRDYEVIMARPIHYLCHHPDILSSHTYSIHILLLGYNVQ